MGEFYSTQKIPFDKAWSGTLKAMEELEFVVMKQEKDVFSARLIARGANDKKIKVNLEKQSEQFTEIRIWVDTFGDVAISDEAISKLILDKIKERAKLV
jgi:broad-specificity NMP kinase